MPGSAPDLHTAFAGAKAWLVEGRMPYADDDSRVGRQRSSAAAVAVDPPEARLGGQQAAWRAQGRYMASVRLLPKATRVRIRAIREKKGSQSLWS